MATGLCSTQPSLDLPFALSPTTLLPSLLTLKLRSLTTSSSWQVLPFGRLMASSLGAFRPPLAPLSPHLRNQVRQVLRVFMEAAHLPMPPTEPGTENSLN